MMKLALFSYSYHLAFGKHAVFQPSQPMDLFQFIDRAKGLGVSGVQIDPMHYASLDDGYLRDVASYLEEAGLFVEHGAWGVDEATLRAAIAACQILGASLFRTALGFTRYDDGIKVQQRLQDARVALNNVKQEAEDCGIKIAIENHCDATTDELIALMGAVNSPNIGVCVDPGNFMIYLEDPVDSIRRLVPYIFTSHVKDYAPIMENYGFKYVGVPLGEGVIDVNAIVDILQHDVGLEYIMIEVPVEKETTEAATIQKEDDYVRRSIAYARSHFN